MALTVLEREPMLPLAACWPATQAAADWAAANCGICGCTEAAPAGAAVAVSVAEANNTAKPREEAPVRVRRMIGMILASRTSTRKTPQQRGHTEPRPLCL